MLSGSLGRPLGWLSQLRAIATPSYGCTMAAIPITRRISIASEELVESYARASGPGGQHVNTTDSAVILRFDVANSPSLPDVVKARLSDIAGSRLTKDGVIILRSDGTRSQFSNRQEVRERLFSMIREATLVPLQRRKTKPTKASKIRRVDAKAKRGAVKAGRAKVRPD